MIDGELNEIIHEVLQTVLAYNTFSKQVDSCS